MIRKFLIVPNILKFSTMFEGQQNTVLKLLKKKKQNKFFRQQRHSNLPSNNGSSGNRSDYVPKVNSYVITCFILHCIFIS